MTSTKLAQIADRHTGKQQKHSAPRQQHTNGSQEPEHEESSAGSVLFEQVKPWPDPVDGAQLLTDVSEFISKHVYLPDGAADAAALWIAHTYVFELFPNTPRLTVTSADKQSGKSTFLNAVAALSDRPLTTSNISEAALYRCIEKFRPTLFVDEADNFGKEKEELRKLVNAGAHRGGCVIRCTGKEHEPTPFCVFAPVFFAGIGFVSGTIEDRSISVRMTRKPVAVRMAQFRKQAIDQARQLRRRLLRWTSDVRRRLEKTTVEPYHGASDRQADCWEPLQALALVAGEPWFGRCEAAFQSLNSRPPADPSLGQQLLEDIRELFDESGEDRLATRVLVERLVDMEEKPWSTSRKGGGQLDSNQLARLLRAYDIRSNRFGRGPDRRGFDRAMFEVAWERYLLPPLPLPPPQPAHMATFQSNQGVIQKQPDHPVGNMWTTHVDGDVANPENDSNARNHSDVDEWTAQRGGDKRGREQDQAPSWGTDPAQSDWEEYVASIPVEYAGDDEVN
jgi:hypothetical protein